MVAHCAIQIFHEILCYTFNDNGNCAIHSMTMAPYIHRQLSRCSSMTMALYFQGHGFNDNRTIIINHIRAIYFMTMELYIQWHCAIIFNRNGAIYSVGIV